MIDLKNKLFFLLFFLTIFLTFSNTVKASSCDKYGCANCIYKISNYTVKYAIESDGSNISVSFTSNKDTGSDISYNFTNNISSDTFKNGSNIVCPSNIYVVYGNSGENINARLYSSEKDNSIKVVLSSSSNNNNKTITGATSDSTSSSDDSSQTTYKYGCAMFSNDFISFLQLILNYIRIAAIALAVILSIMDYIKVIFSSDDKSNQKANKNFTTRLIVLAVLFLIPSILTLCLKLFNITTDGANGTCGVY